MFASCRTSVLGLAVLLAAATAAADTVITAHDVLSCWVEAADSDAVRLRLKQPRRRSRSKPGTYEILVLSSREVYEIRLSDSSRVAELAPQLPQVRVTLDSGEPVPPPAVRAREMLRLRLDRAREAHNEGLTEYADVVDTLAGSASPAEIAARCREMDVALREYGRSDETVEGLLRDVSREAEALRKIGPYLGTCCLSGTCGGLLGLVAGMGIGFALFKGSPDQTSPAYQAAGCLGGAVGCTAGSVIGLAVGTSLRVRTLMRHHRNRVNDLIRRVNRVVASQP